MGGVGQALVQLMKFSANVEGVLFSNCNILQPTIMLVACTAEGCSLATARDMHVTQSHMLRRSGPLCF